MSDTNARSTLLPRAAAAVKARVVGAGLRCGALAAAAGVAQSTLSRYLSGEIRNDEGQIKIWRAFKRLTGERPTLAAFWGKLLSERIAA